jgi:hypothetical protein
VTDAVRQAETYKKQQAFLEAYSRLHIVTRACTEVGIGHALPYQWRARDAWFAEEFEGLQKAIIVELEEEAFARAKGGMADRDSASMIKWLLMRLDPSHYWQDLKTTTEQDDPDQKRSFSAEGDADA